MNWAPKIICLTFAALLSLGAVACAVSSESTDEDVTSPKADIPVKLEEKTQEKIIIETKRGTDIGQLNLPEDTSSRFKVKELYINGNTLITTEELFMNMPLVYNASGKPVHKAEQGDLYDLRTLYNVIDQPGQAHEVSRRTMQGFTRYILSVYRDRGYAGVYVYISAQAVQGGVELQDGILPIDIVEATVSEISVTAYDPNGEKKEKGILKSSIVKAWSPIKAGQVVRKKKLDDFVNLLNLNPDRYVAAVISRGSEPDTLAIGYDIHEANPWHYYLQLDNSGVKERQWAPRIGVVNTNLSGRDDRFTAMYQGKLESNQDNYAMFASYDFPLFTPRLRLNLYGGRSKFDISGGEGIDFLGNGSFYGGLLRFNVFQKNSWFFDITSSLSHEKSKFTPSLFPILGSDVEMDLWGIGFNVYRSNDMSSTSFAFDRIQNIGGSSQEKFWDPLTGTGARTNADRDFVICSVSAAHSQHLDPNGIQRLSGSFRWIKSDERLAPSKMTTFGGLYSVRGYMENRIVADGGILASFQYEYDLAKKDKTEEDEPEEAQKNKRWLTKLAPLVFFDYGRAKIKNPVPGEKGTQKLYSIGTGIAVTIKNNIDASIYYGYPLTSTDDTEKGRGRWSFNFILRW
ncbi:MAG: ShlB/FhaC/HecB family hemolysin secretion/activation protein [Planctomycetota bacterium]|jgi:hemolysin activation/secretion protein